MDDVSKDFQKLSVRELKEELEQAEIRLQDLNEAAELAFRVIREKENLILTEIAALRDEIKSRSGRNRDNRRLIPRAEFFGFVLVLPNFPAEKFALLVMVLLF